MSPVRRTSRSAQRRTSRSRPARRWRGWVHYSDEKLLELRLRDLDLRIRRTVLELRVKKLYAELERRGLRFRPHVWLSTEWFSPDGVPGIGIPFYLAHPRLMKLEARQMFEVEGGSQASCMRILRHETGHAIDTAYRLHYRKRWRELFGRFSDPYPRYYTPRPSSRKYVLHLDAWYAQAHPAEDFAETFAVWLTPRSDWRQRYKQWPVALEKLEYVHELMRDIADRPAVVRSRAHEESVQQLSRTLGEHYRKRRQLFSAGDTGFLMRDLTRLFSDDPLYRDRPTAAGFLRALRREIRDTVSEWTGHHPYTIDQVLQDLIDDCRRRKLRLARPQRRAKLHAIMLVTMQTMRSGRYEIAL